jgi:hypothetical protein
MTPISEFGSAEFAAGLEMTQHNKTAGMQYLISKLRRTMFGCNMRDLDDV